MTWLLRYILGGLVILALGILAFFQRRPSPRPAAPAASARPAALPGDPCLARGACPAGCYRGPSTCIAHVCSEDIACRPAGYDPRAREKGLLWLDGRAVPDAPNACLSSKPPCPAGCYEGPSRCSPKCAEDRVCRPRGFDPRSGRLYSP